MLMYCRFLSFSTSTDLVVAAANTEKVVNSEKGQFMSPESMKHAVQKKYWIATIPYNVMVTDRGTMFGYQDKDC
jgi:2-dehydro-3-deoxyphosphooctonate aldolase (KDO 8-P synthase)